MGLRSHNKIALDEIAKEAMKERGFIPEFPPAVLQEVEGLAGPASGHRNYRDMRDKLWISIDNPESRDLDQLTYAEEGKIYVAVADVDALVKKGTAIDGYAAHNTTSVYTPTRIFPMLPLKLSNDLTSLNPHTDRCAIVIEVKVDKEGKFELEDLYPAIVRNQAKLDYPCVGALLEGLVCKITLPPIPGLREQLHLQDEIAQKIQQYRNRQGALEFGEVQLKAIVVEGIPVDLEEEGRNRAHKLIENSMIAANVAATHYLKERELPILRRVVKKPKNWLRIVKLAKDLGEELPPKPEPKALRRFLLKQQKENPLSFPDLSLAIIKLLGRGEYVLGLPGKFSPGHFDLAEHEYAHATAPNRRFPDLIMQRLLKHSLFSQERAYRNEELAKLALHCTEKEDDAAKIERRMLKCAAAAIFQKRIGETFSAMVTGAGPKGTWVRLQKPPVEGKLVRGFEGADVGDFIRVKLIRVDIVNGHIDFEKAK